MYSRQQRRMHKLCNQRAEYTWLSCIFIVGEHEQDQWKNLPWTDEQQVNTKSNFPGPERSLEPPAAASDGHVTCHA